MLYINILIYVYKNPFMLAMHVHADATQEKKMDQYLRKKNYASHACR